MHHCQVRTHCHGGLWFVIRLVLVIVTLTACCRRMVSAYKTTVRHLWHVDGLRGFYRGLSASYAGSLETAIYFVLYEQMKKQAAKRFEVEQLHPVHYIYMAAMCKLMASPLCYPHG